MNANAFRFLDLPAEMRNMTYDVLLVRPKITITARYIYPRPGMISNTRIPFRRRRAFIDFRASHYAMTYEAAPEPDSQVYINMLLVNRQVYREAASIFYSRNTFSFTPYIKARNSNAAVAINYCRSAETLGTCDAFFCDRPNTALAHIKSLELFLMDGAYTAFHRDDGLFGCDYDTSVITNLVNTVNVNITTLRHLSLHFAGGASGIKPGHFWLSKLCELPKVKSLAIRWVNSFEPDSGKAMVHYTSTLRKNILQNAERLGKENIRVSSRHLAIRTTSGVWKRMANRLVVVECHDDEQGRTLLAPLARLTPLFRGARKHREDHPVLPPRDRYLVKFRYANGVQILESDTSDYDWSDDEGDRDSLNEVDTDA